MKTAEQAILSAIDAEQLGAVCRAAFSGQSGVILKRALCALAHPFHPPVGRDALETYRQIGRSEVVNLLLKYSAAEVTPEDIANIETQNHGRSKEPTIESGNAETHRESDASPDADANP